MKPTKRIVFVTLLVLALPAVHLLWASGPTYGELDLFGLILGIIENPDPIAQCHYVQLTANPDDPDAREAGKRLDGRPVFEFDRGTEKPFLTWAYDAGMDHDIAFNAWKGNDWDPKIEFITSSTVDELDPRLFVDSYNNTFMTWWEDTAASRILVAKRDPSGSWTPPSRIGSGRRPSVAVWQGDLVVSYERDNGSQQEIVFARSHMGGPFIPSVIAVTPRSARLDSVVHVHDGILWIDWKHGNRSMGYSIFQDGKWKPLRTHPWNEPSWVGELNARQEIETGLVR